MSLYDDLDTKQIPDWSTGINKLLQPQLSLKNKITPVPKKSNLLTPVINLKTRKEAEDGKIKESSFKSKPLITTTLTHTIEKMSEWDDFGIQDEYHPHIPNEYEKIIKERRERNKKEDMRDRKRKHSPKTGFAGRPDSEEDDHYQRPSAASRVGACVAPPKSLQETVPIPDNSPYVGGGSSVAAKIMAKYGFKDGQGLGKQEQGISMALQVEKTSKRGGRIIHEKETPLPVAPVADFTPAIPFSQEPSITEMMKSPSKIVLLRNMVGPGDVDEDLEPEVKDECNTKYGDVISVHINELQNRSPEESVRIFVEFKRIESAIKAVVDLNGRFFGGRQVRAGFYSAEKFENFIFNE